MANQKTESALLKKVWDIANVMSSAGVGFTDYITQLTYILFLKMDDEKEEFGLGSSIPEDCKWKGTIRNGLKEIGVKEIPQWVKDGKRSPTGRHTFTTWRHWAKDEAPLPSGLLGPVQLQFACP